MLNAIYTTRSVTTNVYLSVGVHVFCLFTFLVNAFVVLQPR